MLFAGWMILANKLLNPSYTAAGTFHALFLLAAFAVGRRAYHGGSKAFFQAATVFAVCLAGWALWQRAVGAPRAQALFEAPATLTAVLNLVLIPALVYRANGAGGLPVAGVVAMLMAGLTAANSRGGWLGFTVALLVAALLARRAKIQADTKSTVVVACALGAGVIIAWGSPFVLTLFDAAGVGAAATHHSMIGSDAVQSGVARLSLYELAWRSLESSSVFTGSGYLSFYYVLERARLDIPSFENAMGFFVHNDYLQTLLELGLPGFIGLLAVVVLPLLGAWRAITRLEDRADRLAMCALAAGAVSMATHALVDFPFYIPVCLLLYGASLGIMEAIRAGMRADAPQPERAITATFGKAATAAAATLLAWMLVIPVVAEAAAANAHRNWRAANGEKAAYWFELARRLDARDWRYHWYAGQFWYLQAAQNRKPEAARLAERAFAEGMAANPREVRNLVGRLATHRELREILPDAANAGQMTQWAQMAMELSPHDLTVQREVSLVYKRFRFAK